MEDNIGLASVAAIASLISLAAVIYPFKPFKKRWTALLSSILCFVLVGMFAATPEGVQTTSGEVDQSPNDPKHWVISERLNRRTCPSVDCGIVGQLFFREGTRILERRGKWARITMPYDASCVGGRSEYVDTGDASCDPSNGISGGKFSEWVSTEFLSNDRPSDPAESALDTERMIAGSDDFARYRTTFTTAAQSLIAQGRCTGGDFLEMGGWVKSSNHRNEPIYFAYCGGSTTANRLYLNAVTGDVFK